MRSALILVLVGLVLGGAMLICGMAYFQEKFLFYPTPTPEGTSYQLERPFEEVWIPMQTSSGKSFQIHSLFLPVKNAKTLILYFHGNAGSLQEWAYVGSELAARVGASVWIMDYPGYGRSGGSIEDEAQLEKMATAFFEAIPQRGNFENVVLYGRSIGSGLAAYLAGRFPDQVSGVVLETPYRSLRELVGDYAPWFPARLLRYQFDNEKALLTYPGPVLIFHGQKDEVIPIRHSDELAEALAARGSVSLVEIPEGEHNDLYHFPDYGASLVNWFRDLNAP